EFEVQAAERGRQGAEPGAELSQDSAYDGSAGYQQDDTDSQASSLGSSGVEEEEEEENPGLMKTHFDTLAATAPSIERFETDLRVLQGEERPFLNPRLSISTRFLSRFQDRLRAGPPSSLPSRIAEEPCR
ncbi:hypothetical protein CRUP_023541, partial [Coryphaenoides rupestris]